MYDIINNWEELDSLKSSGWEIDRQFDRELNEFEFILSLTVDEDDIFRIYVRLGMKLEKGYSTVYVDTFNAWSNGDLSYGIDVLKMIQKKCCDFESWCLINGFTVQLGRT